jgi:hypothetical protein
MPDPFLLATSILTILAALLLQRPDDHRDRRHGSNRSLS